VRKRTPKAAKVYAHGAVKPVTRVGEWIWFGATVADGDDYPVHFQVQHLPELIAWLQEQVEQDKRKKVKP
jgi:hypothetical protein